VTVGFNQRVRIGCNGSERQTIASNPQQCRNNRNWKKVIFTKYRDNNENKSISSLGIKENWNMKANQFVQKSRGRENANLRLK
jgi:hypothetical protein